MSGTYRSVLEGEPDIAEREVLRTPRRHRNQGALQRALRQERVARRRNFLGWLLTVLLAAGAGGAIVFWVAERAAPHHPKPLALPPAHSSSTAAPPAVEDDPVPAGVIQGLPAR